MKNIFKWEGMRASEFYSKLLIFKIKNFMDCYIIKMNKAVSIGYHTDKIEGKKHYRINIFLRKKKCDFWVDYKPVKKRIVLFRPDIQPHSLSVLGKECSAIILSIGFAINIREVI